MTLAPDRLNKLVMEMRRGMLILSVLRALDKPHYGYSLRKSLAAIGLDIDEDTLYPLLRRLEEQNLLVSEWKVMDGRKRRFYWISPDGVTAQSAMMEEWQKLNLVVEQLAE